MILAHKHINQSVIHSALPAATLQQPGKKRPKKNTTKQKFKSIHASNHLLKDALIWQSYLYDLYIDLWGSWGLVIFWRPVCRMLEWEIDQRGQTKSTRPGHVGGVKILYLDHVDPSIQRHHVGIDYACMTSLNKGIPILPFHLVQGDVYSQRK